jgi:hypothetical protein
MSDTILAIGLQALTMAEGDEKVVLVKRREPGTEGGVEVSLERARRIIHVDPESIYATLPPESDALPAGFDAGGEG